MDTTTAKVVRRYNVGDADACYQALRGIGWWFTVSTAQVVGEKGERWPPAAGSQVHKDKGAGRGGPRTSAVG